MSEYTPGPWYAYPTIERHSIAILEREGLVVAEVLAQDVAATQAHADARLIAAAPDLLAALRDVLPMAQAYMRGAPSHPDNGKIADALDVLARVDGAA